LIDRLPSPWIRRTAAELDLDPDELRAAGREIALSIFPRFAQELRASAFALRERGG